MIQELMIAGVNGITWGLTVALIALGLNLIFGLLEIVNFAHGSFYMFGAVIAWFIISATGSFMLALIIAPLIVGGLGMVTERFVLRRIEDDLALTLIATFALLLIFDNAALLTFGPGTRPITAPVDGAVTFAGMSYPIYRLVIAAISILLMIGLYVLLFRTRHGLWMRGIRQDIETASALGVPRSRVYALTFALGTMLAALAGVLLAPIVGVNHLMGLDVVVIAFTVVIVGGLGSLKGVLAASLLYGLIENIGTVFISPVLSRVLTFAILILFILIRPSGLYGSNLV